MDTGNKANNFGTHPTRLLSLGLQGFPFRKTLHRIAVSNVVDVVVQTQSGHFTTAPSQ